MAPVSNLPLSLPAGAAVAMADPPDLRAARSQALQSSSAAGWRAVAEAAVKARHYSEAADAYHRESVLYATRVGDKNAAQIEELKSARYSTRLALYRYAPTLAHVGSLARLEPESGCYVGAFIDRDDSLPQQMLDSQTYGNITRFNEVTGKAHASFFMYREYGQPFPTRWVQDVGRHAAIAHIAWEPRTLDVVKDDEYLHTFVQAAKTSGYPIFIRFAGEMNGNWTPYHADPKRYREAFRMVYRAFRGVKNVAVMWCPNSIPQNGLDSYYPGDDACDWVGVNLYSVPFLDNDPKRPAGDLNPVDLLDPVYQRYSARKPIAIGEYAASHQSSLDHKMTPAFASLKMAQLYGSLATRYPRVKMVDWYDCNNLKHARPGRQLNNYLLTDVPSILEDYRHLIASACFLGAGQTRSPVTAVPLVENSLLLPGTRVEAWVRTYVQKPKVYFQLDHDIILATDKPGGYSVALHPRMPGRHLLQLDVFDDHNRLVERMPIRFRS